MCTHVCIYIDTRNGLRSVAVYARGMRPFYCYTYNIVYYISSGYFSTDSRDPAANLTPHTHTHTKDNETIVDRRSVTIFKYRPSTRNRVTETRSPPFVIFTTRSFVKAGTDGDDDTLYDLT